MIHVNNTLILFLHRISTAKGLMERKNRVQTREGLLILYGTMIQIWRQNNRHAH